ncbi:MAG TPA: histidine kinase dimerization/phosphoacceptor domain -containing protein [Bryobacteraceae bacterium]|nr:histidine kinase dimerization/phosphoacceptor domain -containing protein [Bryobacteraceae bacterium]
MRALDAALPANGSRSLPDPANLLQIFQDSAPDYAFITLNLERRVEGWSLGAERMFGYAKEEALGQTLHILFTSQDRAEGVVDREFGVAAREGRAEDERWLQRKDKTRFWASGVLTNLYGPRGDQSGFCKIIRDLTERKLTEDRLAASLQEKEFLLREIHHRVKNNLQVVNSLISMQARITKHEEMREIFTDLQDRIRTIVTLHETLYSSPDIGSVLLGPYLEQLLNSLAAFHSNSSCQVSLNLEAADIVIDIEQALPLGLILNELVTNCFKHAFPSKQIGTVVVCLRYLQSEPGAPLDEAECELSVSDNGVGMQPGRSITDLPSMGLRIVQALTKELHGTVTVKKNQEQGTTFAVCFPFRHRPPGHPAF